MDDVRDLLDWDKGNVLLAGLLPERSFVEWGECLAYDPRRSWKRPFGPRQESHIKMMRHLFVPTEQSVSLACSLHSVIIDSLRRRDARLSANRRRIFEIAELDPSALGDELERMPWYAEGAEGAIVRGPTGCSKTHSYEAYCRHIPQVIEHGASQECGWENLKQLVWLRVFFPDDANRRSLYLAILDGVDKVLGTTYLLGVKDRIKNGPLLLKVIRILTIHRCGLLILDEAQVRNLGPMILGSEFVITFLRIMNSGVPMLLAGNPMAFENVLQFSQDLRRYTDGGIFDFAPIFDELVEEWKDDLVPFIWGWTIFDKKDQKIKGNLAQLLYRRTGGVPDFLSRYRRECLLNALRRGATRVEMEDLDAAYYARSYRPLHKLIDAYVVKDAELLINFKDQPILFLQDIWADERARRAAAAEAARI